VIRHENELAVFILWNLVNIFMPDAKENGPDISPKPTDLIDHITAFHSAEEGSHDHEGQREKHDGQEKQDRVKGIKKSEGK
jgi:hypothetical protein